MVIAESQEDVDLSGLKDRRIGRYGIKIETSSSSPTARYANFMSILGFSKSQFNSEDFGVITCDTRVDLDG